MTLPRTSSSNTGCCCKTTRSVADDVACSFMKFSEFAPREILAAIPHNFGRYVRNRKFVVCGLYSDKSFINTQVLR